MLEAKKRSFFVFDDLTNSAVICIIQNQEKKYYAQGVSIDRDEMSGRIILDKGTPVLGDSLNIEIMYTNDLEQSVAIVLRGVNLERKGKESSVKFSFERFEGYVSTWELVDEQDA